MPQCPICQTACAREITLHSGEKKKNEFFPFCSQRCKLLDLGKWASGQYVIAGKNYNPQDESASSNSEGDPGDMTKIDRDNDEDSKVH